MVREAIDTKGTVLVMDDEETIRDILKAMLEVEGYDAVSASNGEEAVDIYREALESGRPMSAVIMDLTVPGGMGGAEAVGEIKKLDPDVKAIITSGYSQDPIVADYREHGFSGVLTKPFRMSELHAVLSRILCPQN